MSAAERGAEGEGEGGMLILCCCERSRATIYATSLQSVLRRCFCSWTTSDRLLNYTLSYIHIHIHIHIHIPYTSHSSLPAPTLHYIISLISLLLFHPPTHPHTCFISSSLSNLRARFLEEKDVEHEGGEVSGDSFMLLTIGGKGYG